MHGDGRALHLGAGAHGAQDVQHGTVALQGIGPQAVHTHGAAAQGPGGQQVGGPGPVAFHLIAARTVGAGLHGDAQAVGAGGAQGAPAAVGQELPRAVGLAGLHAEADAEIFQAMQGQAHIGPGHGLLPAQFHAQGRRGQRRCQQQAGEILAGGIHAQAHAAAVAGGIEARGPQQQGRTVGTLLKAHVRAQGLQGAGQLVDGPLVHARRAVDAEQAVTGGQHGGQQAAGGAGFVHVAAQGRVRAAPGTAVHAGDAPAAFLAGQGFHTGTGGAEDGAGAFQVAAVQHMVQLGRAVGQGRADAVAVRDGFGGRGPHAGGIGTRHGCPPRRPGRCGPAAGRWRSCPGCGSWCRSRPASGADPHTGGRSGRIPRP